MTKGFYMKKQDEKGMHDGHRNRLLDLAVEAGFDAMSDYQVVEFFLTYILPRGDVNPLAHRLLNEYQDYANILDANAIDLTHVYGINDRSAKRIAVFKNFFDYYTNSRLSKKKFLSTYGEIIDLVEETVRFRNSENILLIGLSPSNRLIQKRILSNNSINNVSITLAELSAFLLSSKASKIALGHCHPYGIAEPSETDDKSYKETKKFCELYGVEYLDAYIVGMDGVYSHNREAKVRNFMDVNDVTKMLLSNIEKDKEEASNR